MEENKFSVAMCVYGKDEPTWFDLAVQSILNQTVQPDEVVLVVDGPVPEELDVIIKKYESDSKFNVIRFEENQGHGNARRKSVQECKNNIIALMDADDISVENRFEKQLECLINENADIVGGNISEFIGTTDNIVGYRRVPENHADIIDYMKTRCPFNQVTVMFKKEAYLKAGGYIDWYCEEDYYLWLRMMQNGANFKNVNEVLCNVRVGKEMYQRRGGLAYFKSEAKLQKYMLTNKIIDFGTYFMNVTKRLIVQVLLPNKIRGWVFKKFAREN